MCSETSPRISFSNDLNHEDEIPIDRRDTALLESNFDFEFSICGSVDHDSSLADDLFADGMILPAVQVPETSSSSSPLSNTQIQRNDHLLHKFSSLPPRPYSSPSTNANINSKKENTVMISELEEKSQPNKSFWGFKRSSSLNCEMIRKSICPFQLLSRSNSTGSVSNSKQKSSSSCKDINKQNSRKLPASPPPAASSTGTSYVYTLPHKAKMKKNYGRSHGNINGTVKFSPVLNVPPPYIAKGAANFFGLGSFLRNGKEKIVRK